MEKNSSPKRFIIGLNVLIQIILAAAILVIVNVAIFYWYPPALNLTQNEFYQLSGKTKEQLKGLKAPVEIIVYFQKDSRIANISSLYEYLKNLLREYSNLSPQLKIRYSDPDADLLDADRFAKEYNVHEPNVVIFVYQQRHKVVPATELFEVENYGNPFSGGGTRIKSYKAEQQFTAAIQNVLDPKQSKVYFLTGHGEADPEDFEERGVGELAKYIKRDNLLVEKLNLFEKQGIPEDCDALILCAPQKAVSEIELTAIEKYLTQNGKLLVLLDPLQNDPGLEKFLKGHGVQVGNDIVLFIGAYMGGKAIVPVAHGVKYAAHPITQSFKNENILTEFPAARSVDHVPSFDPAKGRVTVLIETPEKEWAETNLVRLQKEEKAEPDDKDRKGPVPLAVAVEPVAAGEMEREGARIVVFGSSEMIRNRTISNQDLFMNSLNWLLKRQQLLGIAAKIPQEFALRMSDDQQFKLFISGVVLLPLSVAVIGFLVWFKRRK